MRRVVTVLGLAVVANGVWVLQRTHAVVGACHVLSASAATSGIDKACSRTLFAYVEGFVLVIAGLLIVAIALVMIDRQRRFDLKAELHAVPRHWTKRN